MKKSIIAIAVGTALAAAGAAQAEVTVYGRGDVSIDSQNNGDESFIYISSNSSRIGFKAMEEIEGGLKAGFVAEQTITMDGVGASVFDRNTYVSLGGGFGSIILGKIDTPVKTLGRKIDFFSTQIGDSRNIIQLQATGASLGFSDSDCTANGDGTGAALTGSALTKCQALDTAKGFGADARPQGISYTTPDMGGVTAVVMFTPEDGTKDASAFSLGVNYAQGPILVGFGYESHGEGLGLGAKIAAVNTNYATFIGDELDSETVMRLGGSFSFGDAKVAALFQSVSSLGGLKDNDLTSYGVGGSYKIGAGTVKAQVYMAGEIDCGTDCGDKTGATMIALGYDHSLSKSTTVYAAYSVTNNDDAAGYNAAGAGSHSASAGVAVDSSGNSESPSAISFGMVTKF